MASPYRCRPKTALPKLPATSWFLMTESSLFPRHPEFPTGLAECVLLRCHRQLSVHTRVAAQWPLLAVLGPLVQDSWLPPGKTLRLFRQATSAPEPTYAPRVHYKFRF
jgi:hypothetical protein